MNKVKVGSVAPGTRCSAIFNSRNMDRGPGVIGDIDPEARMSVSRVVTENPIVVGISVDCMCIVEDAPPVRDSRPRVAYRLPDGAEAAVIFDHGDTVPAEISFTFAGGAIGMLPLVDATLAGSVLP